MSDAERGFPDSEFRERLNRAQLLMIERDLAALFLTTEPEIRYFSGFLTRFWESPTRPWFLIVPATGDPVAVIPSIGAHLMGQGAIKDIRTWASPDYEDDGIGLVAATLTELIPADGVIGVPSGPETHLRLPLSDWARLQTEIGARRMSGDAFIMQRLRMVKSAREIAKIRMACSIADRAFARVPEIAGPGVPLDAVFRRFQVLCLEEGADWVSYLAGGAGQGGYGDVISPATATPLQSGDVLMLDTGLVWDGYFCDFDRNFALGVVEPDVADAHSKLIEATATAFERARPGATASDLCHAMTAVLGDAAGGGRFGHGLGMQLTEWPSLIPEDGSILEPGMVLTLEPGIKLGSGRVMVHEENIVVTDVAAEYLSTPARQEMPFLGSEA